MGGPNHAYGSSEGDRPSYTPCVINLFPLLFAGCFNLPNEATQLDTTTIPFDNDHVTEDAIEDELSDRLSEDISWRSVFIFGILRMVVSLPR